MTTAFFLSSTTTDKLERLDERSWCIDVFNGLFIEPGRRRGNFSSVDCSRAKIMIY
jgi:hypothetical protein